VKPPDLLAGNPRSAIAPVQSNLGEYREKSDHLQRGAGAGLLFPGVHWQ
jgi:hypothetical protein